MVIFINNVHSMREIGYIRMLLEINAYYVIVLICKAVGVLSNAHEFNPHFYYLIEECKMACDMKVPKKKTSSSCTSVMKNS